MKTADAVVVGGGTLGAWCAYFLRLAGLARVVVVEKGLVGTGASSRAAGVVRTQGGTPEAVRLGLWSREFYLSQRAELGIDSGFTEQGYLLPCFTEADRLGRPALRADDAGRPAARALAEQALLDQDDPRQPGPAQEVRAPGAHRPAAHHHGVRCITRWHTIDAGID